MHSGGDAEEDGDEDGEGEEVSICFHDHIDPSPHSFWIFVTREKRKTKRKR